ncbi:MAG: HD domain-containing protein [Anaerolineae bacterium]|nr:HD domain-containing protein [Anaerolineae bacterium]
MPTDAPNAEQLALQPAPFALAWPPVLAAVRDALATWSRREPVLLVGGAVRDALLRRPVKDLDFATPGDGRDVARRLANALGGAFFPLDAERKVGRAIVEYQGERFMLDVAQFRGPSLLTDLTGRDFTINALAAPLDGDLQSLYDPTGGLADLRHKRLRLCAPDSIAQDPVRALRAVRQSVALQFQIEPETRKAVRRDGPRFVHSSPERVRDEFMTMLGGPRPHVALRALDALGLLALIVPEVEAMRGVEQSPPHIHDVWQHTLSVVERLDGVLTTISPARTDDSAADAAFGLIVYLLDRFRAALQAHLAAPLPNGRRVTALLVLAALLHDCGKPPTASRGADGRIHFYQHERIGADLALARCRALRLSNDEAERVSAIVRHHMRPMMLRQSSGEQVSRRAVHRFWKAAGEAGIDVCVLTLADYLGMVGPTLHVPDWLAMLQVSGALLDGYLNRREEIVTPPPLVTGHGLMQELQVKAGPLVGQILAAISEAQAAGEVTTVDEALALARMLLDRPSRQAPDEDAGE